MQISPDMYEAIRSVFVQLLGDLYTNMPGQVIEYDTDTLLATVQPVLQVKYRDETASKDRPPITNVPVQFPRYGASHIRGPVKAGDEGLILWTMRSMDLWLSKGGVVDPLDNRRFDYSDAVFVPGINSQPNRIVPAGDVENLEIVNGDLVIEVADDGKISVRNDQADLLGILDATLTQLAIEPFITGKSVFAAQQVLLATLKL